MKLSWLFAIMLIIGGCSEVTNHYAQIPSTAEAEKLETGSTTFPIPEKIRGRVAFWVSIYGQYGKYHRVVHHRMYPQAVFTVLDFYDEAKRMGPGELEKHIAQTEKGMTARITEILNHFYDGGSPRNPFERQCYDAMKLVPGGKEKYKRTIDEDLIRTQTGVKERFAEAIQRSGRYLQFMETVFAERGLPKELAKLPFVESSFDYKVVSSAGAAGLWQFMKRTGKEFGMRINNIVDERRDPIIATRGAANYLQSAYKRLDSWPLALTSYNHGVGGVAQKVKQMGTRDLPTIIEHPDIRPLGFASNNFYPSFLAALVVTNNSKKYFPGVKPDAPLKLRETVLTKGMSVKELSRTMGVSLEDLQIANYSFSDTVWNGRSHIPAGYKIRIPENLNTESSVIMASASTEQPKQEILRASADLENDSGGTPHFYTVKKGDTLGGIARKFGTTTDAVKSLNNLSSSNIKLGQSLRVRGTLNAVPPRPSHGKSQRHLVKKGDTLSSISKKYKVSVGDLKQANGLTKDQVKLGQKIVIP